MIVKKNEESSFVYHEEYSSGQLFNRVEKMDHFLGRYFEK
jgi:hypothetical protein